jgi:WD40 repeat protein
MESGKQGSITKQGTTIINVDDNVSKSRAFATHAYSKLGTCVPPTGDVGSVLVVSKYVMAYGLKGGNVRVLLVKGPGSAMLNGHSQPIVDMAIAPDVRPIGTSLLATLSSDGVCRVWEISNQDAGGELDTRESLQLKTRSNSAQRVLFHPGFGSGKNNVIFMLHGGFVTGIPYVREVREENAVDPSSGLLVEKFGTIRLARTSNVLDLGFVETSSGVWKCITGHEDGTCCIWALTNNANKFEGDDDGSSVSMDSAAVNNGPSKEMKTRMSLVNVPPIMIINVSTSPVLTVGFVNQNVILTGCSRNTEIALWSIEKDFPKSPFQKVSLTRSSQAVRSFRSSLVRRVVDSDLCLVLFESKSVDAVLIQIPEKKAMMTGFSLAKGVHPVFSLTADYDLEKDRLVCHVVDVDSIEDLDLPSEVAFGTAPSAEMRNVIRRASKKAESITSGPLEPVEWSDKPKCCVIS